MSRTLSDGKIACFQCYDGFYIEQAQILYTLYTNKQADKHDSERKFYVDSEISNQIFHCLTTFRDIRQNVKRGTTIVYLVSTKQLLSHHRK